MYHVYVSLKKMYYKLFYTPVPLYLYLYCEKTQKRKNIYEDFHATNTKFVFKCFMLIFNFFFWFNCMTTLWIKYVQCRRAKTLNVNICHYVKQVWRKKMKVFISIWFPCFRSSIFSYVEDVVKSNYGIQNLWFHFNLLIRM